MRTHQDRVSVAAYYLWQSVGSPNGRDQEIWFTAERRLLQDDAHRSPARNGNLSKPWFGPPTPYQHGGRSPESLARQTL